MRLQNFFRQRSTTALASGILVAIAAVPVIAVAHALTPSPGQASIPLPETRQAPSAAIAPTDEQVNLVLINETRATVVYQAVGETDTRLLAGESSVTLRGLDVPTTLTFQRQDSGLLSVTLVPAETRSQLEVTFDETTDLDRDKNVLTVNEAGQVYLN